MRIVDTFDIDGILVSVFKMDNKISVKFESNGLEQTYKFRDGSPINNPEDVKKWMNEAVISKIKTTFASMALTRTAGFEAWIASENSGFIDIL